MSLLVQIALIAVATVGMVACLALLPTGAPIRRRRQLARRAQPPEQLIATQRLVLSASGSKLYAYAYLRPVLADIAASRLAARGWTLATMPEDVGRGLLGDLLWEMVRPGYRLPEDRQAPGVSEQELGSMLDALEEL